jgi:hypothetical protein
MFDIASVAERSIASDCKSDGLRPTQVRILPGAPIQNIVAKYEN